MLKFLFILISFLSFTIINAQHVTIIQVSQESDKVVITYDISNINAGQTFDINVECSTDNGQTFSIIPKTLTGDLKGIRAGSGKQIIWDVLSERQELTGDQFVFQLVATINNLEDSYSGNSGTFTDSRDGNVYKWVRIGTQVWMAENLNTSKFLNGDVIPIVVHNRQWSYLTTAACCNYENNDNFGETFGRLYNWFAVSDNRNMAPSGWHIPSHDEWSILINKLGGENIAGGKLKATGTSLWSYSNIGATNQSGFSALPGGYRGGSGQFVFKGLGGSWWSNKESIVGKAWYNFLG